MSQRPSGLQNLYPGRYGKRNDVHQAGSKQSRMSASEKDSDAESKVRDVVPVRARLSDDQTVKAETAKLVGHASRGYVAGR